MEFGELKPILATLLLPPTSPLLLAAAGLLLMVRNRKAVGATVGFVSLGVLWLLACNGTAVALAKNVLPPALPLPPAQLAGSGIQAIVVLGGGVVPNAPEYGEAQPSATTLARLRYGAWLARQGGQPVAFAGGKGWGASADTTSEGVVARRLAKQEWSLDLRWVDDQSRDTQENARMLEGLMRAEKVRRIALVTDAWHMPRAQWHFEQAGFQVVPAPMGFVQPARQPLLEWLPSGEGLATSRQVLREWLALRVARR